MLTLAQLIIFKYFRSLMVLMRIIDNSFTCRRIHVNWAHSSISHALAHNVFGGVRACLHRRAISIAMNSHCD